MAATKACIDLNISIWCAIGAALAWLMGTIIPGAIRSTRIEDVLVGMFGAVIGAEFVSAMIHRKGEDIMGFGGRFGLAVFGAVVMLGLLALMRRSVGPMRSGKSKSKRDY